jgi:hypothetical protein
MKTLDAEITGLITSLQSPVAKESSATFENLIKSYSSIVSGYLTNL